MATDAQILSVRKDARLHGHEYFTDQTGSKLELVKQMPPIEIINVYKNTTAMADVTDYAWNGFRTMTLVVDAIEGDVFHIEWGSTVTSSEIGDLIEIGRASCRERV